ncbi:MAG: zf-TFIIB domain-containing protein [Actinobacteria bacterium]|nr:zf-TFIIB domain-containing protein [Actinomycetota bacterium]
MKCPVCNDTDLLMTERQGVEIDYCPSCRGVWLDRGELDKIIERSGEAAAPSGTRNEPRDNGRDDHRDAQRDHDDHGGHDAGAKKKGGFLGDLLGGLGGD